MNPLPIVYKTICSNQSRTLPLGTPLASFRRKVYYINMIDVFDVNGPGRPPKRAALDVKSVGMSFKVDPRLKNLLMDIADGYGISITELLLTMALKEAGLESLDECG